MKKALLLASMMLLAASGAAVSQDGPTIRIASEGAYPPFNFLSADGTLQGLDIDIANALCAEMKAKCTIVTQEWDGMIPGLVANKFDAVIASMSITEERKKQIAFSNKYYVTPLAVVVPKDSDFKGVSPADMDGKSVGAQAGTTQSQYADATYAPAGADVKAYPTDDEARADLVNGRLDAIISDKFLLVDWINKDGKDCCKLLGDVPGTETEVGVGLRQGDTALKERFNKAIDAIVANGTYARITQKYFPFDIYASK